MIDEDFVNAYRNCSEVCLNIGNYSRALRHLEDLMKKEKGDDPRHFHENRFVSFKRRQTEMAREFLLMAEEEESFNDEIHYLLGECYSS
ncbi:MAG: hypothetical protein R2769_06640 [Saprospiraceae bacterium]